MVKRKETIYRCDYCNKPYLSMSGCKKHESWCFANEEKQSCITCLHNNYGCSRDEESLYRIQRDHIKNGLYTNCSRWQSLLKHMEELESDN